jgi:hypothetical protein
MLNTIDSKNWVEITNNLNNPKYAEELKIRGPKSITTAFKLHIALQWVSVPYKSMTLAQCKGFAMSRILDALASQQKIKNMTDAEKSRLLHDYNLLKEMD